MRGVHQPLHVFRQAENRGTTHRFVTAQPLEHRRSVAHHVRQHVNLGVIPGYELAVAPDFVGFRERHMVSPKRISAAYARRDKNYSTRFSELSSGRAAEST